jgi:hypothetical protein
MAESKNIESNTLKSLQEITVEKLVDEYWKNPEIISTLKQNKENYLKINRIFQNLLETEFPIIFNAKNQRPQDFDYFIEYAFNKKIPQEFNPYVKQGLLLSDDVDEFDAACFASAVKYLSIAYAKDPKLTEVLLDRTYRKNGITGGSKLLDHALLEAAKNGHIDFAEWLIKNGSNSTLTLNWLTLTIPTMPEGSNKNKAITCSELINDYSNMAVQIREDIKKGTYTVLNIAEYGSFITSCIGKDIEEGVFTKEDIPLILNFIRHHNSKIQHLHKTNIQPLKITVVQALRTKENTAVLWDLAFQLKSVEAMQTLALKFKSNFFQKLIAQELDEVKLWQQLDFFSERIPNFFLRKITPWGENVLQWSKSCGRTSIVEKIMELTKGEIETKPVPTSIQRSWALLWVQKQIIKAPVVATSPSITPKTNSHTQLSPYESKNAALFFEPLKTSRKFKTAAGFSIERSSKDEMEFSNFQLSKSNSNKE